MEECFRVELGCNYCRKLHYEGAKPRQCRATFHGRYEIYNGLRVQIHPSLRMSTTSTVTSKPV